MTHKYEGGQIVPPEGHIVQEHYHVDYFHIEHRKGGTDATHSGRGYVIDVEADNKFTVCNTVMPTLDALTLPPRESFKTLDEAVKWCFEQYAKWHPGEEIVPLSGAGAPNEALKRLGLVK